MLDIHLGAPQSVENLVVFPLLNGEPVDLPYELLTDALVAGMVHVTEVHGGHVPSLLAHNLCGRPVLVLDGEQLIGAKQNRTTNRSILLPDKSKTEIPVSCMEQGRWRLTSHEFGASPDHAPATVRRQAREVEETQVRARTAPSMSVLAEAQGAVWSEIQDLSAKLGVRSATSALDETYEARRVDLQGWAKAFPVEDEQVGLLALTPRGAIGLDILGSQAIYARVHGRLLNGYLMDALHQDALGSNRAHHFDRAGPQPRKGDPGPTQRTARRFMRRVASAQFTEVPTAGLGRYSVLSRGVVGGELVDAGQLAHLCAFPSRRRTEDWKRVWRM